MPINPQVRALLDAIGKVEAGARGYNAIYKPAERKLGPQLLTKMTLTEVYALQTRMLKANAKSTAVGRYQFLRKTLTRIADAMKIGGNAKFDPDLQDRLALHLMEERGLSKHLAGRLSRTAFANNLAKEWASLPVVTAINGKKVGQSYYAGDGLNHALVKPEKILALIDALGASTVPVARPKPVEAVPVPAPTIPAAVPIPMSWFDSLDEKERKRIVLAVQKDLLGHGYVQVGGLDGLVGDNTRGAVRDFRAKNGLPEGDHIDQALIDALKRPDAVRPVIAPDRANASLKDLREKGSVIVDAADKNQKGAIATIVAGIGAVGSQIVESAGGLMNLGPALDPLRWLFMEYGAYIFGTVIVAMGGVIWWQSKRTNEARLRDHQVGNTSIVGFPPE